VRERTMRAADDCGGVLVGRVILQRAEMERERSGRADPPYRPPLAAVRFNPARLKRTQHDGAPARPLTLIWRSTPLVVMIAATGRTASAAPREASAGSVADLQEAAPTISAVRATSGSVLGRSARIGASVGGASRGQGDPARARTIRSGRDYTRPCANLAYSHRANLFLGRDRDSRGPSRLSIHPGCSAHA
jgi:hypothetical protein